MSLLHPRRAIPFWSAIITQVQGSVSVAAGSIVNVDIQPPAGETWLVTFGFVQWGGVSGTWVKYMDYDGVTERGHSASYTFGSYGYALPHIEIERVLTNSLYARLSTKNAAPTVQPFWYGYSGFKLAKPLYSPKRVNDPNEESWKRELTIALPTEIAALEPYAVEVWDVEKQAYVPVIMLEEDTPLARDPLTNFPVERLTDYITVEELLNILRQRDDPSIRPDVKLVAPPKFRGRGMRELTKEEFEEVTGHKKYFDEWRDKGLI